LLPFDADFIEQDVAAIAQQLLVVHAGGFRGSEPTVSGEADY
jgi:hypothetical protein